MEWLQLDPGYWAIISSWAAVAGVGMSAYTFRRSSSRLEETEQIRIVHDIRNDLFHAEDNILKLKTINDRNSEDIKDRAIQYLNVCEWYSLLVNKERIKMQELIDYFTPKMCDAYKKILGSYPDLKKDHSKFKEFKTLCRRLGCEND